MNHYLIMDPNEGDFIIAMDSTEGSSYIDLYDWFRDIKDAFNNFEQEYMTLQEFLAPSERRPLGFNLLFTFTDTQDLYDYFTNHPELFI